MAKQTKVWLERADGAEVGMLFDPESLESIGRLTASMRDPLVLERERDKAQHSADYWQDRCLQAERALEKLRDQLAADAL